MAAVSAAHTATLSRVATATGLGDVLLQHGTMHRPSEAPAAASPMPRLTCPGFKLDLWHEGAPLVYSGYEKHRVLPLSCGRGADGISTSLRTRELMRLNCRMHLGRYAVAAMQRACSRCTWTMQRTRTVCELLTPEPAAPHCQRSPLKGTGPTAATCTDAPGKYAAAHATPRLTMPQSSRLTSSPGGHAPAQ